MGRFTQDLNGKLMTKQSDKKQCDINDIVARAKRIGSLDPLRPRSVPVFMDCREVPNFQEAQNIVIRANELLYSLSPNVRERFGNDPQKMMEFVSKKENFEEAVKMGLMKAPEPKRPEVIQKVQVVTTEEGKK